MSIIGANSVIGVESVVESGVRVWVNKQIASGTTISYDVKYGNGKGIIIDEDGICGDTGGEVSPIVATKLGASLVAAGKNIVLVISLTQPQKLLQWR